MKKLSLIAGFFLVFFIQNSISQKDPDQVNFFDGEFFLADEYYRDALLAYMKVYDAGYQENANINYRIGICYLNLPGEKSNAIPYLEKAITRISDSYNEGNFREVNAPPDALLFLGNAYRINYELDKAIDAYKRYKTLLKDMRSSEAAFAQQQIDACERAKIAINNPVGLKKENIGGLYNSSLNNFNTVLAGNGSAMAYMSEQRFYEAVFYLTIENGRFSNPINITPQIESDGDQYVTALNNEGTRMLLTKISNFDADIMISNYESRRWTKSENLGKPINSKYFESHACFSPDEKTIYFTSNRKESFGGMDIFYSVLGEDNNWSEPLNIGESINTQLNEETPFMCKDGKTLYFSSQGHKTIGGYDIFMTTMQEDGSWSEPVALPYPLNTTDDDLFFFPLCEQDAGYMTRIEPDGLGSGDIYRVELVPYQEVAEEVGEEPGTPEVQPVKDTTQTTETLPQEKEVLPDEPIRPYRIAPIFFEFDSYALTGISMEKLDEVAQVMQAFPQIKLDIQGHTDSKGPDSYNQLLSERRAGSVKKYLESKGVPSDRMTTKGFSESAPIAVNTNPDGTDSFRGRKLNRRVEFKIDPGIMDNLELEKVEVPEDLKID